MPDCGADFAPIWDAVNQSFWPAVYDGAISETEKQLFTLPVRMGDMSVCNPIETAGGAYTTSRTEMSLIVDVIKGKGSFSMLDHNKKLSEAISCMRNSLRRHDQTRPEAILGTLDLEKK